MEVAEARRYVLPDISADDFVSFIDNPYMPLEPGTTFVYNAETADEFILDNITVTDATREIIGVSCRVVYDVETVDGTVTEETDDWYAQDDDGNVWYFGEDTVEYIYDDNGNLIDTSTEGSWEAGVDGALPGISSWPNQGRESVTNRNMPRMRRIRRGPEAQCESLR